MKFCDLTLLSDKSLLENDKNKKIQILSESGKKSYYVQGKRVYPKNKNLYEVLQEFNLIGMKEKKHVRTYSKDNILYILIYSTETKFRVQFKYKTIKKFVELQVGRHTDPEKMFTLMYDQLFINERLRINL